MTEPASPGPGGPDQPKDVEIKRIEYPDEKGGLSMVASHPGFATLAIECVRLFREGHGVNYVEWTMQSGDPEFGTFSVVIQRRAGVTPAEKATRLAKENEALRAALYKLANPDSSMHDVGGMTTFAREALEGVPPCA
jgi:hypothetical protein